MAKKIIKNIFNRPLLWVVLLSLPLLWPLVQPGYFSHHDDLQVMRIFEMRKCFADLQIPCRWVPDMGYGNGFPLFNYYSALPYYIGAVVSFLTGFIGAAKVLFLIPLVFGGVTMFLFAKELFGRFAGVVAAVLYLYAPYRALDSYVRGAVAESFALSLAPLLFFFSFRLMKKARASDCLGLALSLGAMLLCHNIMTILFVPTFLVWVVGLSLVYKTRPFKLLLVSLGIGVGLAAFFVLPAFFEKNLVQTETLTRFDLDFRAHFVTVGQLFFSRFWGYGASVPGPNDGISFQIGWPHWWLALFTVVLLAVNLLKKRLNNLSIWTVTFGLGVFTVSVFMMHNKSAFVWEQIHLLQYAQFPWRFLSLSIFSASLLGGWVIAHLPHKVTIFGGVLVTFLAISLNFLYFRPNVFYSLTDQQKISGALWEEQQRAGIFDYLPKTAIEAREPAPSHPLMTGQATADNFQNHSNWWSFQTEVKAHTTFEIPVYDFPNWQVYIDNNKVTHNHQNSIGRIQFSLEPGEYQVRGVLQNTLVRTIADTISLVTTISLVGWVINAQKKQLI